MSQLHDRWHSRCVCARRTLIWSSIQAGRTFYACGFARVSLNFSAKIIKAIHKRPFAILTQDEGCDVAHEVRKLVQGKGRTRFALEKIRIGFK
jgi:hypothetical protein